MRQSTTTRQLQCASILSVILLVPVTSFFGPGLRAQGSDQFDIIRQIHHSLQDDSWEIRNPTVTRQMTEYPTIVFREGDKVVVTASGCVQTGGKGLTWKRYVDPQGPNADQLYHGLVSIPFATNGLVRINTVNRKTLSLPARFPDSPAPLHLRLGYEDGKDDYGDNGYWGHDAGTGDQCKSEKNAVVVVRITHAG